MLACALDEIRSDDARHALEQKIYGNDLHGTNGE
jgi:hypothetical protein